MSVSGAEPILAVRDLSVSVIGPRGKVQIVDGVSFQVGVGEAVAIVGESGSGKTLTALSLMQLLPAGATLDAGSIKLSGRELVGLSDRELCKLRGGALSMVAQEPGAALNPVYTVGSQIGEAIRLHSDASRREARARAIGWLAKVGLPEPDRVVDAYPHELSGGMKQRVLIAMALANEPSLLIADEPTSALDRTLQAHVLELFDEERARRALSLLLVSHDLATVAEETEQVVVMYAGRVVEIGPTFETLTAPLHPYTAALLACSPEHHGLRRVGAAGDGGAAGARRLPVIDGAPPSFEDLPPGCRFAPRCTSATAACKAARPPLVTVAPDRSVACVLHPARLGGASAPDSTEPA